MGFLSMFLMTALLLEAVMDGRAKQADVEDRMVVGGTRLNGCSEFPWLVRLTNGDEICAGSIIGHRHILTAAHCVYNYQPHELTAYLGGYAGNESEPYEDSRNISDIHIHHDYVRKKAEGDIAVLNLTDPVEFENNDCVAKIHRDPQFDFNHRKCWSAGWGVKHGDKIIPNIPMKVDLPVHDMKTCRKKFNFTGLSDKVICTGDGRGVKDNCYGDSGGPVACRDHANNRWVLVGAVTGGKGCALRGKPTFNANVAYFHDWINDKSGHPRQQESSPVSA